MNKKKNEEEKARKNAIAESFWERTNTLIKQCGKTQREISLLLDKENPRKLQNWTAGKGLPDAEEAVVIADALNTTVEYLVNGEVSSAAESKVVITFNSITDNNKDLAYRVLEQFVTNTSSDEDK